ncbi:Ig-like domain-containing protein, partial [Escherichia coli]|uniref:Ig-like domain-containing protein n=1 Tax=Escherichia coli TaxID=562 RepID=UPI0015BCF304
GTVGSNGSYSVTLNQPQTNGQTVTVTQTDPAGNASPEVAVTAPDITAPLDLTAAVGASGTIVTGSGEPGATVTVRD